MPCPTTAARIPLPPRYLHKHHIVHRDIKPENLIYETSADDSRIIVSDFGLACVVSSDADRPTKACGTPGYVAPEVLRKDVSYVAACVRM